MTVPESAPPKTVSPCTRAVAALLLLALPAIVVWVALEGRSYDPARYGFEFRIVGQGGTTPSGEVPSTAAAAAIPETFLPPVPADAYCRASDPPERYDESTLYEKIDGAAPEYFERGFRALLSQAYTPRDPERFGCELFIYDMGSPENAAAIFRDHRGDSAGGVDVGKEGYRAAASRFFHDGQYYVIVLNADEGEDAERFSEHIARGVADRIRAVSTR